MGVSLMDHIFQVFVSAEVPGAGELSRGSYWDGIGGPAIATVSLRRLLGMTDEVL
jgi:hypothetical protein